VIKVIALLKRKSGISKEEFSQRWLVKHAKLAAKMPGLLGYRINIALPYQPAGTNIEPLYDGTAELWWKSADAMDAAFTSEIGKAAGTDADEFTDVRIHVYTEENIIVPGPIKRTAPRPAPKKKKPVVRKTKQAR
jgi:uncharacterized protein (TIGR02118 family)